MNVHGRQVDAPSALLCHSYDKGKARNTSETWGRCCSLYSIENFYRTLQNFQARDTATVMQ